MSTENDVGDEGADVGEDAHVGELDDGPFPASGFAADDGEGGHALHGEGEEDQEGDGSAGGEVLLEGFLQTDVFFVAFHAVDGAEGTDDDFAGGEGSDEADADFPVEAEGLDEGFDGAAEGSGQALFDGWRFAVRGGGR